MGGIGFIEHNKAVIMHDNMLINLHMLEAARMNGVDALSVHLVAPASIRATCQNATDVAPLKEEDAYPADRRGRLRLGEAVHASACAGTTREDYGLETRVVRFHNIFGPLGTYDGGREKSPAAICRKIALARRRRRDRGLGRRRADPLVLLHRRLRRGHLPADASRTIREPLNLGQDRHDLDQRAGRHRRPRSPARRSTHVTT